MTRYITAVILRGSVFPIGDDCTPDNSYSMHAGAEPSVWSGRATCVQSFGRCKTPHAVNVERALVNGWCSVCLANGANE